jgi:predicted RNA-binding protein with PIN domain
VSETAATERLLRPALAAAVTVARAGDLADPPVPVPSVLRPVLGFARLNGRALAAARRALEGDDEFRSRVADSVDEPAVGRAAWLWLTRPEGWEEEFESGRVEAATAAEEAGASREVARLRRALTRAEEVASRNESARRNAEADAASAREAVAAERSVRRDAEGRAAAFASEVERLTGERAAAVRSLKDLEATHAAARAEVRSATVARADLEAEIARLTAEVDRLKGVTGASTGAESPALAGPAVAAAVARAAEAAQALSAALAQAATGLDPPVAADSEPEEPPGHWRPGSGSSPSPSSRRVRRRSSGRRPRPLPPAVLDDSPQAAAHLVRLPGAVVLVDGYNASMAAWPDRPIDEQRRRLVDALDELHARTGADPVVVFDGVAASRPQGATVGRAVRVLFTDAGVEADDVVMGLVDEFPVDRPVVVASSDGRVRSGAEARGANVVSSPQLLATLGR